MVELLNSITTNVVFFAAWPYNPNMKRVAFMFEREPTLGEILWAWKYMGISSHTTPEHFKTERLE
jgi:hypothetical protein